jgi:hypothetical protein
MYMTLVTKYQISEKNAPKNILDGRTEVKQYTPSPWVAFLDPTDSYFLFADLVGFYTH